MEVRLAAEEIIRACHVSLNTSALPVICKYKNKIKIGVKERFKKQKNNNQHIEFWQMIARKSSSITLAYLFFQQIFSERYVKLSSTLSPEAW